MLLFFFFGPSFSKRSWNGSKSYGVTVQGSQQSDEKFLTLSSRLWPDWLRGRCGRGLSQAWLIGSCVIEWGRRGWNTSDGDWTGGRRKKKKQADMKTSCLLQSDGTLRILWDRLEENQENQVPLNLWQDFKNYLSSMKIKTHAKIPLVLIRTFSEMKCLKLNF